MLRIPLLAAALYGVSIAISLFEWHELPVIWKLLILGFILLGAYSLTYSQVVLPAIRVSQEVTKLIMGFLLPALIEGYRKAHPGNYTLRANLMFVSHRIRRGWPPREPKLRIDYATEDYGAGERALEWAGEMGAVGRCVVRKNVIFYDPIEDPEAVGGMTGTHLDLTKHLKSIVSVPVFRWNDPAKGKVIAVLSMDSESLIGVSGFKSQELHSIAMQTAATIGKILP